MSTNSFAETLRHVEAFTFKGNVPQPDPHGKWVRRKDVLNILSQSNLRADPALLAEAVEVLRYLLNDIQDYQRINNLGGENNHSQVRARAFIAKLENRHE